MNKEEFEKYLVSIGGLVRTYREDKGPIVTADFFAYSDGWYEMTKNLIDELLALGWDKRINQVKEKFGGLRFYIETYPEGGIDVIRKYEDLSYKTCEKCGKEGVLRKGGWILTLCDEHAKGLEPMK
jgi:hypothetical protein